MRSCILRLSGRRNPRRRSQTGDNLGMSRFFKIVGVVLIGFFAALVILAFASQFDHRAFDDSAESKAALTWMKARSRTLDEKRLDKEDWRAVIEQKEAAAEDMVSAKSW